MPTDRPRSPIRQQLGVIILPLSNHYQHNATWRNVAYLHALRFLEKTCYDKGNGALRVIDFEDGQTCRSTETSLSWKDGITGKVANSDKLDGMDSSKVARASLFGSPAVKAPQNGDRFNESCALGEVRLFAGDRLPGGWRLARGQEWSIDQNTALFALLGTRYGGNDQTNFALPDLRGAEPNGAGTAAPNYAICTEGYFPG